MSVLTVEILGYHVLYTPFQPIELLTEIAVYKCVELIPQRSKCTYCFYVALKPFVHVTLVQNHLRFRIRFDKFGCKHQKRGVGNSFVVSKKFVKLLSGDCAIR